MGLFIQAEESIESVCLKDIAGGGKYRKIT